MQTHTAERVRAISGPDPATVVPYAGAAAFVIAASWFWLATKGVTIAAAPRTGQNVTQEEGMHVYYRWLVTTLPQERYYTSLAIAGFLSLAAVPIFRRDRLGGGGSLAGFGAVLTCAGSLVWITGSVLQLGGHRAVGLMATHVNPIQTTNSIAFTIDTISAAFALAAFTLLGAGMFALASAASRSGHRAWAGYTVLVALALLVTAGSYAAGNDDFST